MANYEESKIYQIRSDVLIKPRSTLKLLQRADEVDSEERDEKLISFLSGKKETLHDMLVSINSIINLDWVSIKE